MSDRKWSHNDTVQCIRILTKPVFCQQNKTCSAFWEGTEEETGILPVLGTDIGHDVLIEELEDEWDTVGKHQVLGDNLKL